MTRLQTVAWQIAVRQLKTKESSLVNMAEKKTILLRLSPKMWEEINKWAEDEFRSVNGQIEYLLKEALIRRNKSSKKVLEGQDEENR